ncbi:hypothetical protein JCM6882_008088 [Rhodosporidiobolus microsporus]
MRTRSTFASSAAVAIAPLAALLLTTPSRPALVPTRAGSRNAGGTAALVAALAGPVLVSAQAVAPAGGATGGSSDTSYGWAKSCPKSSPCLSEYGFCGAGVSCLAGCNPQGSYGEGFCAPLPVCQNSNYTFNDDSRIQRDHSKWDGDVSKYDFTLDTMDKGNNEIIQNGELVLSLTENGGGTKISTTRNVLYGTIQANMKTVGAPGVVTAFITMSGVKDEIDFEWVTNNTDQVESNYFWEGVVPDWTESHGGKHKASNRATNYITYGIQWTPDQLDWLVNGKSVRTLHKKDTVNGREYPQTPSRVQFSVWPAGIDGTSQGTIDWAGGMIDWDSSDYKSQGFYSANIRWVSLDCYDGSDFSLPYNSTNSTSSRLARRDEEEHSLEALWKRQNTVNSYIYGSNDTNGQIGVSGSPRNTVINSAASSGQNMIVKNGDTKGVSKSNSGNGSNIFGDTVVGNWWAKQGTAVKAGIIVGACAVALFILVAICTIWARSRDRRKRSAAKSAALKDTIPLVKPGGGGANPAGGLGASTADLPGKFRRQDSEYAESIPSTKGSYRGQYDYGRSGTPPVPTLPQQYQQQQGGYGGGYGQPMSPGGYGSPYGGYPQQQQGGGYGAYNPQGYAQQWPGYGNTRY